MPDDARVAEEFPVVDRMFQDFKRMTEPLSPADRHKLFHDNAARFYRL